MGKYNMMMTVELHTETASLRLQTGRRHHWAHRICHDFRLNKVRLIDSYLLVSLVFLSHVTQIHGGARVRRFRAKRNTIQPIFTRRQNRNSCTAFPCFSNVPQCNDTYRTYHASTQRHNVQSVITFYTTQNVTKSPYETIAEFSNSAYSTLRR